MPADQRIIPRTTKKRVVPDIANDPVIARAAQQQIITIGTEQKDRGSGLAGIQRVIAGIAVHTIHAAPRVDVQRNPGGLIDIGAVISGGSGVDDQIQRIDHIKVGPVTAIHNIGPMPADQRIIPWATKKRVITDATDQPIIPIAAIDQIIPVPADQNIITTKPVKLDRLRLAGGVNRIIASAPFDLINPAPPPQRQGDAILVNNARDIITLLATIGYDIPWPNFINIAAFAAVHPVCADAADQQIITGAAKQEIVAITPKQAVIPRATGQGIVAIATPQVIIAIAAKQ